MSAVAPAAAARWWREQPAIIRFPFRFAVLLAVLVVMVPRTVEWGPHAVAATTGAVEWAASAIGLGAATQAGGSMSFAEGVFRYQIVPACTTTIPTLLFIGAVLAYPATWRQRATGLVAGVPALFALNVVRLVVLAWVGVHATASFDLLHWLGFQVFFVFVVGLLWVAWIRLVVQRDAAARRPALLAAGWVRSAALFAASFGVLGALATLEAVQDAYSKLFFPPFTLATHVIWPGEDIPWAISRGDLQVFTLTTAAFVSLHLATRQFPLAERLDRIATRLLPLLYAAQAAVLLAVVALDFAEGRAHVRDGLWGTRSGDVVGGLWETALVVLLSVVPFTQWLIWTRRTSTASTSGKDETNKTTDNDATTESEDAR